ncbi:hypothetical protein C8J57DRAFT_1563804 [Mycena rebaudengoi]|nr:hypothetical protein C8J57DRAFT_1563804 [Mycena rebaudengoi]
MLKESYGFPAPSDGPESEEELEPRCDEETASEHYIKIVHHPHTGKVPTIVPLDAVFQESQKEAVLAELDARRPWYPFKTRADFEYTETALHLPCQDGLMKKVSALWTYSFWRLGAFLLLCYLATSCSGWTCVVSIRRILPGSSLVLCYPCYDWASCAPSRFETEHSVRAPSMRKRLSHVQGLPPVLFLFPILPPTTSILTFLLASPPLFSLVTIYPSSHNANTTPADILPIHHQRHAAPDFVLQDRQRRVRLSSFPELASLGIAPTLLKMASFR